MAANQQLKDYIIEQTKLGVSKDTVKSVLLGAGWKEEDINQAVTETETGVQEIASLKPSSPVQTAQQVNQPQSTQQPQPAQPTKPAEVSQVFKPVNMPGSSSPVKKDSPVPFITSDIFQPKSEPVFQSSGVKTQITLNSPETKPQTISIAQNKTGVGMGDKILPISLGVISIILLGGNIYFFLQNSSLGSKLDSLNSGKTSSESQTVSLAAEKKTLADEVDSLNKTIADLNSQISIFAAPADSSSTPVSFSVTGLLGGGGKLSYSLTTSKNIVLSVKNSKDTDVDTTLKPLLGTQVSMEGTHQPESNQLMVTTVDGKPVLGAAKAAAEAAAAAASAAKAANSSPTQNSAQASSTPVTGTSTDSAATSTP